MKNWSYTIKEGEHTGKTLWSGRYCAVAAFVFCKIFGTWCVLANKRGSGTPNYQGYWNCSCGFIEADETGEEGCARETKEETGYIIPSSSFKFDSVNTKPGDNVTLRYVAIINGVPEKVTPSGGEANEVESVAWIPMEYLDKYKWAFNHKALIEEMFVKYAG